MDYEKKYKEALERAEEFYNDKDNIRYANAEGMLEEIFPELKESEDERIREYLIRYIDNTMKSSELKSKLLACLEEQGESYTKRDVDDAYVEGMAFAKDELEKQGEQKSADKVEPKFKVGDWVVYTGYLLKDSGKEIYVMQVASVEDDKYHFTDTSILCFDSEKDMRSWTIQDAKDGDVLYSPCCKLLWIYKDEKTCYVGSNLNYNSGGIVINKPVCIPTDVQPATKEQRDLLFQKMKEAGYEWDAEKKELKLLITNGGDFFESENCEQKPAWSEEEIDKPNGGIVMEDFNDGNGFYKVNLAYLNKEQVEQIEELVKRWNLQPKGNEDESIISDLLDYFDEDKCLKHEVNDIVKWLKTIKPQRKGWGDNEIKMFDNLITYLDGRKDLLEEIKRTYIDWLKSIKSRVKPKQEWSEEDQNALEDVREAIVHYWGGDTQDILLYWLKTLKQRIGGEQ